MSSSSTSAVLLCDEVWYIEKLVSKRLLLDTFSHCISIATQVSHLDIWTIGLVDQV